jgi:hypothetical protein
MYTLRNLFCNGNVTDKFDKTISDELLCAHAACALAFGGLEDVQRFF